MRFDASTITTAVAVLTLLITIGSGMFYLGKLSNQVENLSVRIDNLHEEVRRNNEQLLVGQPHPRRERKRCVHRTTRHGTDRGHSEPTGSNAMTPESDYGPGLLAPYRVLDLTDGRGLLCGKMLADLGADVVQVEPPGGSPARNVGPFYHDTPGAERSLFWWAYCTNKRGITLDIATDDGAALLRRLVANADFLIESGDPGRMASLGLGYPDLQAINPRLVMVSITAFGQDGPYADYQASDIVGMALGGFMHLTGDGDRPPLRVSMPQFYQHGGGAGPPPP